MRDRNLPHLAARLFDVPLMAHPAKARQVAGAFAQQVGRRAYWDDDDYEPPKEYQVGLAKVKGYGDPYAVIEGIAIVPVAGSLIHKSGNLHMSSGQTGYDGIATKLRLARQDSRVKAIWLDVDSGGGEVAGAFDLAPEIREGSARNGGKPVWAMANESAYSAAYLLAAQADILVAPRTAGVGSIGVIMMHADYTGMLDEKGIKVTVIRAGEHKAKGNPYEALDDATYERWLAECEKVRGMFAGEVAAGRRRMTAEAALATEAQTYMADEAMALGLIDAVASEAQAFAALIAQLRGM